MRNIYIASRFGRRHELRQIRDRLEATGNWTVKSRWIDTERPDPPGADFFMSEDGRRRLLSDLADVRDSDLLVADIMEGMGTRAGMAVEIGYAIGLDRPVILVGDPVAFGIFGNVFVKSFADWDEAFRKYF